MENLVEGQLDVLIDHPEMWYTMIAINAVSEIVVAGFGSHVCF